MEIRHETYQMDLKRADDENITDDNWTAIYHILDQEEHDGRVDWDNKRMARVYFLCKCDAQKCHEAIQKSGVYTAETVACDDCACPLCEPNSYPNPLPSDVKVIWKNQ